MRSGGAPAKTTGLGLRSLLSISDFSGHMSIPALPNGSSASRDIYERDVSSPAHVSSKCDPVSFERIMSIYSDRGCFSVVPTFPSYPIVSSTTDQMEIAGPLSFVVHSGYPATSVGFITTSLSTVSYNAVLPQREIRGSLYQQLLSLIIFIEGE